MTNTNQQPIEEIVNVITVEETNWDGLEKELPINITEEDITSFLDGIDE